MPHARSTEHMTGLPMMAADLYVQLAEFMVLSEAKDRRFVPSERSEGLTLSRRRRGERTEGTACRLYSWVCK